MSNTEYAMITLPLFIMLLSLASSAPSTSWPCSQVFDTCPDNGLLMALGPLRSPDFSLVFPDPLLQLPSLTQTSSVSLSAWFQTSCAKNSCLDTPSINITISSSYPNLLSIVYSFVPSSSPTDSTPSLSLCVTYQSCSSNYTIKSRYNVWTLFSVSVQTRITGVAFQVWSNETAITGSVSGLCVNPVQIEPGSKTFMASQSANAQPSIFNLRIFDRAITQSDLTNLIKVVPGPSRFSSYSSMNDWRLPLAVNDSRLQYQNPNSVYGALIASGPIIPTRSVKIATLDRISLSYFWLQFRLRIGYSQPFSSDVAIPIISLHSDSGAFIILWWVKQSSSSNGGTASKVIMVAGLSTTDPVCPNSSGGSTSGEIAISQSSSSFSTINIASIPKEKGPNLQMTVFTDSSSATTQVDLTKMGFSPFTSGAVWSWRPYTQCHMSVPSEPFRLTVESVRLKNESTLASTWNNEKISALDSSDVCTIGSNNDSSLFPGPACSNHGTYTTNTGQCSCNVDRAQPDCRKCASTFQVTPTWLDSYASCTCSVGQQLNSTICTPCVPGYYSNMSNSICKPCDPGQFANLPRAEKCLKCPQGTVSLSGQSVCQTCGPGKFARVSRCLDCQAGTASNMSSSSQCPACAAGKFSNSTGRLACDFCKPGTYIDVTGSTQCVSCAAGTYAQDIAATTCLPCAPGSISSDGQTNCTICNPGKYEQSNKCLDCLPGRFSLGNETGCSLCAAGSVSSSGSKACTACSAGTFSNVSVCVGCPFGTVSQDSSTICNACTIGSVPNVLQTNCSVCGSGKYQEINNCFSCLPGRFSSSNATSCSLCPLGSVSAGGSKSCTACRPGTWANASACVDCPPGSTSQESSLSCHSCAAGTYTNLNKSLCLPCNPGKYSGPGSIECSSCENGTASGPGQGSCRSCLPGTYSITTDCVTCPNGYYSANAQSVRCDKCLPGTNPDPSRTQCTDCRMGTFSADGGLCSFCPTGRFSNVSKATGCYQCQIGYAAQKGQSSCIKCKPGTAPDRDSELCKACDPGKFSDASSVGVCAPCPPGYYTTDQGQSQCIACSMGRYSNTTGLSTPCFSCTRTSFSDIEGSKECKPCQMHSSVFGNSSVNLQSSAAISQDNCFCDTSFFHNETADSSGFQCDACLAGFVCDTPGTREPLTVKAGYYRDITVDKYLALKCDPEEACLSSTGDTTKCKALYEGYRCSSCIRSLSYRQNQQCRPCGNNALGVTLMVLLFFAFCIVFLAVARPSPAPLTAVGMLLSNIQIIVVFATALTDHWTPEIKTLWQMFSIFNFNLELFRPECALPMDL
uniref:Tyrosine-protein kinase ephrin type A/B receptor-like domain-containing protein n=1 Tax=Spongospora subterranea TaxID=70186 RepID=A0A0H5QTS6_9EUKA|eukprot:CRZ05408.1 hypothetical protein [Spongospora subterranea]